MTICAVEIDDEIYKSFEEKYPQAALVFSMRFLSGLDWDRICDALDLTIDEVGYFSRLAWWNLYWKLQPEVENLGFIRIKVPAGQTK